MIGAEMLWGAGAPVGKVILLGGITPMLFVNLRFVGATVLFWLISFVFPKEHVEPRDYIKIFGASLLAIVLNLVSYLIGLNKTSPVDAAIIPTVLPVITMVMAWAVLREPITGLKAAGVFVGAAGAVTLIVTGSHDNNNSASVLGDCLVLLSQISFCCYLVFFKGLISKYSPVTLMKWMFTFATICVLPFTAQEFWLQDWSSLSTVVILGCIFYIVGPTFLSFVLLPIGQRSLRPTVTAMYNYVQPIVALIIAVIAGLGRINVWNGTAMIMVFTGVYMVTRSRAR